VLTLNDLGSGAETDWPNPKNDIKRNNVTNICFILFYC